LHADAAQLVNGGANALRGRELLVVLSDGHGDGQTSRGVDVAEEDVGDGVADLT
jgi:hypothetical protein